MKPSRSEFLAIRGLRYHIRHWGPDDAPTVFFLHGWMDSSPTFQFVVDALQQSWHVIAPDWRGFGQSEWLNRPYWFPDYYADLHEILNHYSPNEPVKLVGHSMGGGISSVYAAVRPERVSQIVMMDFLGLKPDPDMDSPKQISKWLNNINPAPTLRSYPDCEALAKRLMSVNARLTPERAEVLARTASRTLPDGRVEMACDPWHKVPSPHVYHLDDTKAIWRAIKAPVLMIISEFGFVNMRFSDDAEEYQRCLDCFSNISRLTIHDVGHNLQHDNPQAVAQALETFLQRN